MKSVLLIILLVLGFVTHAFSQDDSTLLDIEDEEIFMLVQQPPRFPGCEDLDGNKQEKEACAQQKMLEYVYGNLKYPQKARRFEIEGQVVIQFIVAKDGSIRNVTLIRDLEKGCGEEAMRVVLGMNDLPEKWTPGHKNGQAVNVKYTLPILFKLGKKRK